VTTISLTSNPTTTQDTSTAIANTESPTPTTINASDSEDNTTTFAPISNFSEDDATSETLRSTVWLVAVLAFFALVVGCIMYRGGSFARGLQAQLKLQAQQDPFWMAEEDGVEHAPTKGDFVPRDKRLVSTAFGMPVPLASLRAAPTLRKEPRSLVSEEPRQGHARTLDDFTPQELSKPRVRRMSMKIIQHLEETKELEEWEKFPYMPAPPYVKDAEDMQEELEVCDPPLSSRLNSHTHTYTPPIPIHHANATHTSRSNTHVFFW
jgi:hypothetical protein